MYEDEDTWEKHYKEWKRLLPSITQDYRLRVFKRLISEYENKGLKRSRAGS